jgi:hypothetical protein
VGGNPNYNAFLSQYNLNGVVQWASAEWPWAYDMNLIVDSTGIYVSGLSGFGSYFMKKTNFSGVDIWLSYIQNSSDINNGISLSLNNSNLICSSSIIGVSSVDVYDSSGGGFSTVATITTNSSSSNSLITIYDTNGILILLTKILSDNLISSGNIVSDNNNNIYIYGFFDGQIDFFNANGINNPTNIVMSLTSNSSSDIYLAKYNSSLELQWATKIDTPGFDSSGPLLVDDNYVYICGKLPINDPKRLFSANGLNPPILSESISTGTSPAFILQYTVNGVLVT